MTGDKFVSRRRVENWFEIISEQGDLAAAKRLLRDLVHYLDDSERETEDVEQVLNFIIAVRMQG